MGLNRFDFSRLRPVIAASYAGLGPYRKAITAALAVVLVVLTAAGVQAARFAASVFTGLPDRAELREVGRMAQGTVLLDRAGQPAFDFSKEQRIEVRLADVSPLVVKALLAVEDQRFYEHGGFDPVRLLGAAWANVRARRAAQGASTITQQLARQAFLTRDKTLRRKLREIVLAKRIERLFSKHEILELYLNKVYFGDGLYGIQAASLGYFGRPASDLSLAQAALLAGLVKSPSTYAPTVHQERAVARRDLVLQAMLDAKVISRADHDGAKAEAVELRDALRREETWGQYFKEQVRRELVQRFGVERVYEGGLRVHTTIDAAMQQHAEASIEETLDELENRRRKQAPKGKAAPADEDRLEAALIALDPATGEVRAMVGGRDFAHSRFNRATQARRQPGSAFKPLVYAAALEAGFTPATLLDGLDDPVLTPEGAWVPEEEHTGTPTMTIRTALRTSSNRAAVRMLREIGIERTADYAERVGLGAVPSVPSMALGSGEVTLLSLASSYLPFANGGFLRKATLVTRVEDRDGRVIYEAEPSGARVVSEQTAFLMSNMLAEVIDAGTANRARRMGFRLPAAGKTGTTNDYHDAWFVGFTPGLLAGVWVGFDQPQPIIRNGYAGEVAVPAWARFMVRATKGDKPGWFKPPAGLTSLRVCRLSGQRATPGCDHVPEMNDEGEYEERSYSYTEHFVRGSEPLGYCQLHEQRFAFGASPSDVRGGRTVTRTPTPEAFPPAAGAEATAGAGDAGPEERVEEPKKKKGFWGRLADAFRRGERDDPEKDDKKDDKEDDKKREKGKKDEKKKDEPG